jgi:hypothetical protein
MAKLKLGTFTDYKPVKITVELSEGVDRDLSTYTDVLSASGR